MKETIIDPIAGIKREIILKEIDPITEIVGTAIGITRIILTRDNSYGRDSSQGYYKNDYREDYCKNDYRKDYYKKDYRYDYRKESCKDQIYNRKDYDEDKCEDGYIRGYDASPRDRHDKGRISYKNRGTNKGKYQNKNKKKYQNKD